MKNVRVRKKVSKKDNNSTDIHLLVETDATSEYFEWDNTRITKALMKEAGVKRKDAKPIAEAVEAKVLASGIQHISSSLIRELVDNELFERGYQASIKKQKSIGMPKHDIEHLILSKSNENSNISANNPEAINLAIAETSLKQYALQEVFSEEVAEAHKEGLVHLHDLGYPTRVYCSSHSLEYIKKYGLQLDNLDTTSGPAKHARTLTGHLNTFLASMQAYYAGALGVAYVNIMYAPYVEGMTDEQMKQEAQHLIFSSSQNAFSRGGQTLFLDFNIHTGVPGYLKDIPAIGPGGVETGKTYGDYTETASRFTKAMLEVWDEGDEYGNIFAFPKCFDKDTMLCVKTPEGIIYETVGELCGADTTGKQLPKYNQETKTVEWVDIKGTAPRGVEEGLAVQLPNNITLKSTSDHSYYVWEDDEIVVKEAKDLVEGDILFYKNAMDVGGDKTHAICMYDYLKDEEGVQVYNLNHYSNANTAYSLRNGYSLIEHVSKENLTENSYFTTTKQKTTKTPLYYEVDVDFARLLGYYIAEGSYIKNRITISAQEGNRSREDIESLCNMFNIGNVGSDSKHIYVYNRFTQVLFSKLFGGGTHSYHKKIPEFIFTSPEDVRCNFIAGAFNGDGTYKNHGLSYSTSSKEMAYGMQGLLASIGIYSTIYVENVKGYERDYYNIYIKGADAIAVFMSKVGCIIGWEDRLPARERATVTWYNGYVLSCITEDSFVQPHERKSKTYISGSRKSVHYHSEVEGLIPMPIKGITPCTVEAYAVEVDHPDHDFITGSGILTKNCDFHINEETFTDPKQNEIYEYACQIAANNGTPYFIFDRDEVTLSACCRLRTVIEDNYMIEHPESMRFCGFQNVTVNLPQCAYKAGKGNIEGFYDEVEKALDICVKAHLQKKKFAQVLMSEPSMPLWLVGKPAADGRPYIDLDQATYIVGIIGLNEALHYLEGTELHESGDTLLKGLEIVSKLYYFVKEAGEKNGMKITIEESPAESASRRLAKIDVKRYKDAKKYVRGSVKEDDVYYTNSIHIRPDADIPIIDRIRMQAKFHGLIESGAMIHAFVGENRSSAGAISSLVEKTFYKTNAAQLTISPEFTVCRVCGHRQFGMNDCCTACGASRIEASRGELKITKEWNTEGWIEYLEELGEGKDVTKE